MKVAGQIWVGWSTPAIITFGSKGARRTESSRLLGNVGEREEGKEREDTQNAEGHIPFICAEWETISYISDIQSH